MCRDFFPLQRCWRWRFADDALFVAAIKMMIYAIFKPATSLVGSAEAGQPETCLLRHWRVARRRCCRSSPRPVVVIARGHVGSGGPYALVTGALALRTRGVYFIMVTLAFAQMAITFPTPRLRRRQRWHLPAPGPSGGGWCRSTWATPPPSTSSMLYLALTWNSGAAAALALWRGTGRHPHQRMRAAGYSTRSRTS